MSLLNLKLKVTHGVNTLLGVVRSLMGFLQARSTSFENAEGSQTILNEFKDNSLLDSASILLTPTSYSERSIKAVKPLQSLGSELVSQPNFNSQGNWFVNNNNQGAISGGTATIIGDGSNAFAQWRHSFTVSTSKKYDLIVTISATNHNVQIAAYSGASDFPSNNSAQVGTHTFRFTPTATTFGLKIGINNNVNGNATLTFVSLKEVSDGDFTFTRGTVATRVNPSGLIESVDTNVPRIDFTSGTGNILMEPESFNYEVNSAALSTGWSATSGASQQVETGITPFGVSGNIKRVSGATNSPPNWVDNADALKKQYTVLASDPASTFTFSVYVKSAGSTTVNIQLRNNTAGPSNRTGAITLTSDWQRVSVTLAVTTTTTKIGVVIAGTDGDILLSGAQLEAQTFATSLIPTSGTTATRNADLANGSGDTSLINTVEGVLYTETACLVDGDHNRAISIGSDGQNYASIQYNPTSNRILGRYRNASNFECQIQFDVADRTQFSKIAFRFKQDDFALFVNGVKVGTDTSGNVLSADTFTQLALNSGIAGTGQPFEGKIKCIAVFKEFLTDAQLISLTS